MAKYIVTHASNAGPLAGIPPVTINGKSVEYSLGAAIELTDEEAEAISHSDVLNVVPAGNESSQGDGAAAQTGGDAGGTDSPQTADAPDRSTTDIAPGDIDAGEGEGEGDDADSGEKSYANDAGDADAFDGDSVRKGKLDEVEPRIAKLSTAEQIAAVRKAEKDADGRKGVADMLDAREAALKAGE